MEDEDEDEKDAHREVRDHEGVALSLNARNEEEVGADSGEEKEDRS